MASTRTVSTAWSSISDQSSFRSRGCGGACHGAGPSSALTMASVATVDRGATRSRLLAPPGEPTATPAASTASWPPRPIGAAGGSPGLDCRTKEAPASGHVCAGHPPRLLEVSVTAVDPQPPVLAQAASVGIRRHLRAAARPRARRGDLPSYVALTKPRIVELLLLTTVPVMFLAERGVPLAVAGGGHGRRAERSRPAARTPSTACSTATSTSRCCVPGAGRCRGTRCRHRPPSVFGVAAGGRRDAPARRSRSTGSPPASPCRQRVLRARLHDGAEAPYLAEHRVGRCRGLLPRADRLDGRHRLAGLAARSCSSSWCSSGHRRTSGRSRSATATTMPPRTCRCCRSSRRPRSSAARSSSTPG